MAIAEELTLLLLCRDLLRSHHCNRVWLSVKTVVVDRVVWRTELPNIAGRLTGSASEQFSDDASCADEVHHQPVLYGPLPVCCSLLSVDILLYRQLESAAERRNPSWRAKTVQSAES